MKRHVWVSVAAGMVCSWVGAAAEVNTRIDISVSTDGVHFASSLSGFPHSGMLHVEALVRVTYIGTASPIGLGSMLIQPTVSNFRVGDVLDAFANGGAGSNTSTPVGTVADAPGQYGRLSPWGRSALTASSAITGFVQTGPGPATNPVPPGTWLRIAQRQVTAWIGGSANTTGNSGITIAQLSSVGRGSEDPAFNGSLSVNVFRFGMELDASVVRPDMVVDIPLGGIGNGNTATNEREVFWFGSMSEVVGQIRGGAVVNPATIIFTPSPGGMVVIGVGVVVGAGQRRRRG